MPISPFDCPYGWEETLRDSRIRSDVETGETKMRRRYTRDVVDVNAEWRLRNRGDAYAAWNIFYDIDCNKGTSKFTMKHPWTGNDIEVRFMGTPRIASLENKYLQVIVTLEWLL